MQDLLAEQQTLRLDNERQNTSLLSLKNAKKSLVSPNKGTKKLPHNQKVAEGSKTGGGTLTSMAPGFSSLPRIDLNKNTSSLSEIFPYDDLAKKDSRSNSLSKNKKGMPNRGGSTVKLPLKDAFKTAGTSKIQQP